jgi:hypothetical protein
MKNQINNKAELLQVLAEHGQEICGFGIKSMGLFGSFVHETQKPDSDVDLFVEFKDGKKTFEHFMHLSFFLEDLLQRRVELVTKESLSPYIGHYILAEVENVSIAA